ncbi:hypothetical protein Nepgr_001701 [Nepenthes gracilis]|uniref:Histone deacetylation protein Rxt3 n=1 Tax=Nepenthes gracilis TaxID=150966 RepID=A0AAD3P5P4_NEPGR|nr:hypothetical protein Nepgr_001701 [Nepenthes gracilis]
MDNYYNCFPFPLGFIIRFVKFNAILFNIACEADGQKIELNTMSGVLKRSHDDGSHSSSSYKYPHEDSSSYPNTPFEVGQDMRFGKIVRTESREADRRSPLHPMYRMPSSMSDSHINHTVAGSENRVELSRDLKENRENKVENRETKNERELFHQSAKIEKDGRFEGRREDNKEVKYDRETHNDSKRDVKIEKDGYGVVSSHSNWKEHLRGKRYPDPLSTTGNVDSWVNLRANLQGSVDMGKDCLKINDREYVEANEAVGENKVDLKGDDKYKDRDRKRKEGKHRDWVDKEKDRNDRRNSLQVGSGSNDYKESIREEREAERWERERERRDAQKDKERPKEREKDFVSWEVCNELEKEGAHNEKEILGQTSEQENLSSEQKKSTDFEAWKNVEREARDRKKERERDVEAERPEKRSRCYDKESDGGADVDGTIEREREAFGYGVQQRKRMLRPRGSPQVANSEARFRSRAQDADGSQGEMLPLDFENWNFDNDIQVSMSCKPEVSTVVYKVGECMHELIKLWKEHEASRPEEDGESSHNGPTLEIRIPAEHLTATNRQVRGGQLWGTDIYTNDSDIVAVLMHTGYCRPTASPPPSAIQELRTTIRVLPPQDCYVSTLRNNVRSRAWGAAIGCSYHVERCCIVKKGGGTIDLEPCLTHTSTVEPTLAPVAVERTMTTRAAALNALRQQRFVREVTIQYNLCNEPWIKYSISIVADKGLKKPLYTSARLKKGEVLYLETHTCRYELCFTGEKILKASTGSQVHETETDKSQNHSGNSMNGERSLTDGDMTVIDVFRWSRCKKPLPQKVMLSLGIPLPLDYVEVLEDNLDWEDVQWSQTGVWIAGKEYQLARVHFMSPN